MVYVRKLLTFCKKLNSSWPYHGDSSKDFCGVKSVTYSFIQSKQLVGNCKFSLLVFAGFSLLIKSSYHHFERKLGFNLFEFSLNSCIFSIPSAVRHIWHRKGVIDLLIDPDFLLLENLALQCRYFAPFLPKIRFAKVTWLGFWLGKSPW
jgi:hypothetical protein